MTYNAGKKSYTLVFPEKILSPEVLGLTTPPPPRPHANGWLLNRLFRAISQLHVFSDLIGSFGLKDVLLLVRCCTYVGFGLTVLT